MFSHVMIGTNDLQKSKAFYDAVLGTLGVKPGFVDRHRVFWRTPTGVFSVTQPINGQPATAGQRRHLRLRLRVGRRPTPGTRPASPTVAPPAKTRPACAKAPPASSTWPTCATPTATRSARCSAWPERSGLGSRLPPRREVSCDR
jgi:catechol 2,3-dioxygenase-like lactoylglutathione lyase family enzyme